jgi:hypothetical protein
VSRLCRVLVPPTIPAATQRQVGPGSAETPPVPVVVDLGDGLAVNPALTGAKAANLAMSMAAGLPVLEGFVITTAGTSPLQLPSDPDPQAGVGRPVRG